MKYKNLLYILFILTAFICFLEIIQAQFEKQSTNNAENTSHSQMEFINTSSVVKFPIQDKNSVKDQIHLPDSSLPADDNNETGFIDSKNIIKVAL